MSYFCTVRSVYLHCTDYSVYCQAVSEKIFEMMSRDQYIPCLLKLFRQYGYDGATLSKISQATGLGKASLYHHFPGGKDEMVAVVLEYIEGCLGQSILDPLRCEGDPQTRLEKMCNGVSKLYEGGKEPCLFAVLLSGSARDVFHEKVKDLLRRWIEEMTKVLIEAGLEEKTAKERAEDWAIAIQGALILCQGLDEVTPFERVLKELPGRLCNLSLYGE